MTEHEGDPGTGSEKQPYETPDVRTEEVFETLALTCAKATDQCTVVIGTPAARS